MNAITTSNPNVQITVGEPDRINKRLVSFAHSGQTLYSERFDPFDRQQTDLAIKEYVRISGRDVRTDFMRSEIQDAAAKQNDCTEDKPYEMVGLADFVRRWPEMREPIIDGLIRRGETANVIAATKIGKSWLAADMALSVASGRPWLKRMKTTQGVVVYIDLELDPETFASRLDIVADKRGLMVDGLNQTFFPICLRAQGHDINTVGSIIDQIASTGVNVSLVVLDAWYRLIPDGTSENDNAAMMAMYNRLDRYAKQLDAAFVVIHHSSKGDQTAKTVTDVGSGAGSMARAADAHIVIRPDEREGYAVVDAACRSFAPIEPLAMFFTYPLWHVDELHTPQLKQKKTAAAAKADQQRKDDIEAVCDEFAGGKPFGWVEVSKLIVCGESRANNIIKAGENEGRIVRHKKMKRKHAKKSTMTFKVPTTTDNDNGNGNVVVAITDT